MLTCIDQPGDSSITRLQRSGDMTPTAWLEATRASLRLRRYSSRTEVSYLAWLRRFLTYRSRLPPGTPEPEAVKRFLLHLATARDVSGRTQKHALSAIRFAFERGLGTRLEWLQDFAPVFRPPRLPVVLSPAEVSAILGCLSGAKRLVAMLLYGSGLRLLEALTLRVKDMDFECSTLLVRSGKGDKDRSTVFPPSLYEPMREHLRRVRRLHERDVARAAGP